MGARPNRRKTCLRDLMVSDTLARRIWFGHTLQSFRFCLFWTNFGAFGRLKSQNRT